MTDREAANTTGLKLLTEPALARGLGQREIVDLLSATLDEEKQTDLKLTEVAEQHIMPAAMGGEEDESSADKGKIGN